MIPDCLQAQAYIRSLPPKRTIPFRKLLLAADSQGECANTVVGRRLTLTHTAIDLISKMLTFDPASRITVLEALEHPWLVSYHDIADEPECPTKFEAWRKIEELETLEEFREALWQEIEEYRREVRGVNLELSAMPICRANHGTTTNTQTNGDKSVLEPKPKEPDRAEETVTMWRDGVAELMEQEERDANVAPLPTHEQLRHPVSPTDPVVTYARRSSFMQPSRQASTYNSPLMSSQQHLPAYSDGHLMETGGILFPTQGYVVPARSRTTSMAGGEVTRKLLRTLSTVSIHESAQGLAGGLAEIAPIGKYIMDGQPTAADAPPSEMPRDFRIEEGSEGEKEEDEVSLLIEKIDKEKREGRFRIG